MQLLARAAQLACACIVFHTSLPTSVSNLPTNANSLPWRRPMLRSMSLLGHWFWQHEQPMLLLYTPHAKLRLILLFVPIGNTYLPSDNV